MIIADYINDVADGKTRRAIQAVFDNLGSLIANDSLKQKSLDRDYTLEEFESCPTAVRKDTGGAPDYAMAKALAVELRADHATMRTEVIAIGTTLANIKTIYDAHTHECPGSSYAASRCSTPDTGAAENSLAASAASAITDTSGSSVPAALTATDPIGTAGDENLLIFDDNVFEYHILGTQTIAAPVRVATGLDVGMDQTADDGIEITQGILANSRSAFVVGTSKPFFLKVKFSIADVSGTDDCAVGFRLAEAYQANIDDYNTFACLNVISGAIKTETDIDGAGTTTTDTTDTWGDGETHTLEVYVDANGAVTYKVDGTVPTTTIAMTITDADTVIPFFYFLNHTDLAGAVVIESWECGLQ